MWKFNLILNNNIHLLKIQSQFTRFLFTHAVVKMHNDASCILYFLFTEENEQSSTVKVRDHFICLFLRN